MRGRAALGLLVLAAPCHAAAEDGVVQRFAAMTRLVGEWRRVDQPESSLRIRFSLTAGGTVLVESWERGGRPHSLTLYHRDGSTIVATHYCPQGNQPRLAMVPGPDAAVVRFVFRDATDLDTAREAYLVALSLDQSDDALLVRRETYRRAGVDETSELRLVRQP